MNNSCFSKPICETDLRAYAVKLYSRIGEAIVLPFVEVMVDGELAKPNNCHENARIYVDENPTFSVIDGWLCVDGGSYSKTVQFVAHSAVADSLGVIYDVTPNLATVERPFLDAKLTERDFTLVVEALVNLRGIGTIAHNK